MDASGSWTFTEVLSIPWSLQLYDVSIGIDSRDKSHIAYTIMDHFAGIDEARVYYVREK